MIEPDKLEKENLGDITITEVRHTLDNYITQTLVENAANVIGAGGFAGDFLTPEGFALWLSDKFGRKNETGETFTFLTSNIAVLELGKTSHMMFFFGNLRIYFITTVSESI